MVKIALRISEGNALSEIKPEKIMPGKRIATSQRQVKELKQRMANLSPQELALLPNTDRHTQAQICLLAFARTYTYFRDWIEEGVFSKIQVYDFELTVKDYNVFFNRKVIDHPEMEKLSPSTTQKVKSMCFKILQEGELLDAIHKSTIRIPLVVPHLLNLLRKFHPQDLKLLLQVR